MYNLELSVLNHTWILDLDGTLVKHNGYKVDGRDVFLPGAKEFLQAIPNGDMVIILTSREEKYREMTESFLKAENIRYDHIIYNAPYGERILVNDCKPGGLETARSVNVKRDGAMQIDVIQNPKL